MTDRGSSERAVHMFTEREHSACLNILNELREALAAHPCGGDGHHHCDAWRLLTGAPAASSTSGPGGPAGGA